MEGRRKNQRQERQYFKTTLDKITMKKETKTIPISEAAFWEAARLREIERLKQSGMVDKTLLLKKEE